MLFCSNVRMDDWGEPVFLPIFWQMREIMLFIGKPMGRSIMISKCVVLSFSCRLVPFFHHHVAVSQVHERLTDYSCCNGFGAARCRCVHQKFDLHCPRNAQHCFPTSSTSNSTCMKIKMRMRNQAAPHTIQNNSRSIHIYTHIPAFQTICRRPVGPW